MIDFSAVKAITIPEGSVKRILIDEKAVWHKSFIAYENLNYERSEDGSHYICVGVADGVSATTFTVADTLNGLPVADVAADAFAGLTDLTIHINSEVDLTNAPWGTELPTYYIYGIKYRPTNTSSRKGQYVADAPNSNFKGGVVHVLGKIGASLVTEINSKAFQNRTSITEVVIGAEFKWLEANVFLNCTGLLKATFKGTPTADIPTTVFVGCTNLLDIYVPWAEDAKTNAPWGATNATIHYNHVTA